MSLTIPIGSTVSVTGGTSKTYTPDGVVVKGGLHLIDASETNFLVRPSLVVRYVQPVLQPDGSFSKAKMTAARTVPKILASGKTVYNVTRAEIELHPEDASSSLAEMLGVGAVLFTDTDLALFWSAGSLAL